MKPKSRTRHGNRERTLPSKKKKDFPMPDIIHLLPDSVANQIAAGEVIQRPASVVKELAENSLDAGASHIQIFIENAGKTLIQVTDNGKGMSVTDARLAFERHATSKIKVAGDLASLRTMGFRGEALPSIASVAQIELRTRTQTDEIGTCIRIEGSRVKEQTPTSCPAGANFAVRNLFFNIPARRKFLKSNQTELANIVSELERIALPHPDVAFTLHNEGSVMLELPAGNFRQRIAGLFGHKTNSQIIPVGTDTSLVCISGFVGMPAASRRKNAHQFLFANGRFMRHPYFAKAIQTAYERLIPDGRQAPFFICLNVDPSRIDVNIHPTKTEIKFEDDNAIFQILLAAVREALGKFGAVPAIDFDVENRPDIPFFNRESPNDARPPQIHLNTAFNPFAPSGGESGAARTATHPSITPSHRAGKVPAGWQKAFDGLYDTGDTAQGTKESLTDTQAAPGLYESLNEKERQTWQTATGQDFMQYRGRFIITPLASGLAVIDQHRAHIRILYEQYMRQLQVRNAPSQRLLFPEMLTVSAAESIVLGQILPQLQQVGFEISPLGKGSFSILGTPAGTEGISPTQLVSSILADAMTGQARASDTVGRIVALALARKVAMPVGQALSCEEMARLVEQLFTCTAPSLTPDGAATLTLLDPEAMF